MTVIIVVVVVILIFAALGSLGQCDAKNPKNGLRCKMQSNHKWRSRGIQGMWHTDVKGGRWRA